MTKNEEKLDSLFKELVPYSGKADSLAGEIVRATMRIVYRNFNDGDHIGVGYGKETCNPAARFLINKLPEDITGLVLALWGVYSDEPPRRRTCSSSGTKTRMWTIPGKRTRTRTGKKGESKMGQTEAIYNKLPANVRETIEEYRAAYKQVRHEYNTEHYEIIAAMSGYAKGLRDAGLITEKERKVIRCYMTV